MCMHVYAHCVCVRARIQPIPNNIQNLIYPSHIREGPFFELFRSDVCSLRYECKHTSFLHVSGCRAHAHARRSAKIDMNIHKPS